ncbi:matrixin family metalloprotease [Myxococcus stipitatus]|nr:matrixin family metalloprotease [Myxococcus stipitatus]
MTQALVLSLAVSCGGASDIGVPSHDETFEEGWKAFRAQAVESSARPGVFIVEGDIAIHGEEALRKYYKEYMSRTSQSLTVLLRDSGGGVIVDDVLGEAEKHSLTYCISPRFPSDKQVRVAAAMTAAGLSWSRRVGVSFAHLESEDVWCDSEESGPNLRVNFEVRYVSGPSAFIALSFPPSSTDRILWIYERAFVSSTANGQTLEATLRHELGHVMGFRHEHIWISPVAGEPECKVEDLDQPGRQDDARQLVGGYDVLSVMHYAQCRPAGSPWAYAQTETDYRAAISIYGLAPSLIVSAVTPL